MVWQRGEFTVDDDRERLDMERVIEGLRTTYWAGERAASKIQEAWENSVLVFGLYENDKKLVGFARVISDLAIVSYLADVFLFEEYRGRGLGKWLVECTLDHPKLQTTRWLLQTRDMQNLYRKVGFLDADEMVMVRQRNQQVLTIADESPGAEGESDKGQSIA